jgi:hypothetical protein
MDMDIQVVTHLHQVLPIEEEVVVEQVEQAMLATQVDQV